MNSLRLRHLIMAAVALAVAATAPFGYRYYRYFETHVSTDDAYVDGNIVLVTPRVSGTVTNIYVMDNWTIKAGDLLLTLDPRDFRVQVNQAEAQLQRARDMIDQLFSQLSAAQAGVRLADSQLQQAQLDFDRAKALLAAGVVSRDSYDRAATGLSLARANRALAEREVERTRALLGGDVEDHARYQRAIVQQAEAALEAAKLDLGYTRIYASVAGTVTHKSVHVGHRVEVGQPLMSLVPGSSLYITANYKETQLSGVRVGQRADIEADIYPGYIYRGRVDSISMGTGSAFSLLPPENATGNWVKVVQRVPVKIVMDSPPPPDKPLRLGLSVEVAIDTGRRGPLLSSTLQRKYQRDGNLIPPESIAPPRRDVGPDRYPKSQPLPPLSRPW